MSAGQNDSRDQRGGGGRVLLVQGSDDLLVQSLQQSETIEEDTSQPEDCNDFHEQQETVEPAPPRRSWCRDCGIRGLLLRRNLGAPFIKSRRRQIRRELDSTSRAAEALQASLAGVVALVQQQAAQFLFRKVLRSLWIRHGRDYTAPVRAFSVGKTGCARSLKYVYNGFCPVLLCLYH
jgi:hypothetical protein